MQMFYENNSPDKKCLFACGIYLFFIVRKTSFQIRVSAHQGQGKNVMECCGNSTSGS